MDVLQGAVVVLKHLGGPQRAVDVGPLVLADVEQPPLVLRDAASLPPTQRSQLNSHLSVSHSRWCSRLRT